MAWLLVVCWLLARTSCSLPEHSTLLQACFCLEISTASFPSPFFSCKLGSHAETCYIPCHIYLPAIYCLEISETVHGALHYEYDGLLQIRTRRWGCAWVPWWRGRSTVQFQLSLLTMTAHVCFVALLKDRYNTHTHTCALKVLSVSPYRQIKLIFLNVSLFFQVTLTTVNWYLFLFFCFLFYALMSNVFLFRSPCGIWLMGSSCAPSPMPTHPARPFCMSR